MDAQTALHLHREYSLHMGTAMGWQVGLATKYRFEAVTEMTSKRIMPRSNDRTNECRAAHQPKLQDQYKSMSRAKEWQTRKPARHVFKGLTFHVATRTDTLRRMLRSLTSTPGTVASNQAYKTKRSCEIYHREAATAATGMASWAPTTPPIRALSPKLRWSCV